MPLRVKTNTSAVDARFKQMGWTAKNSLPGYLRQEARLTAVALAFQTQPFGDNSQAAGIAATATDIRRVYATPGQVYNDLDAKAQHGFWKAVSVRAWDRAKQILQRAARKFSGIQIQPFDGGAAHRQLRNKQGRISKSQKPVMIVQDTKKLKNYVDAETKKVGFGKGGWAACAAALGGTRGIPGWVSRQKSPGSVAERYHELISSVVMTNEVPYASEIITPAGKADAIRIAGERLAKSVRIAVSQR